MTALRKVPPAPDGLALGKDQLVIVGENKDAPPAGSDWMHEIKVDGWRVALLTDGRGGIRLQTKSATDRTWDFISPVKEFAGCGVPMILDGEIAVPDRHGVTKIESLHHAMRNSKTEGLVYFAFDILNFDGEDLRSWPIEKRKDLLVQQIDRQLRARFPDRLPRLVVVDRIKCDGPWLFKMASQCGAEGIVSKKIGTPYIGGSKPSKDWIKTICNPA